MAPLFFFLILAAAGIGVAGWVNGVQRRAQAEEAEARETQANDKTDPFADIPEELPPTVGSGGKSQTNPFGGIGELADDPIWKQAKDLAWKAEGLMADAKAAKAKGDHAAFNEKGKAAKAAYDEALELTAEWEEEMVEKLGENDSNVRAMMKTRNKWFDMLRVLHKTTSR